MTRVKSTCVRAWIPVLDDNRRASFRGPSGWPQPSSGAMPERPNGVRGIALVDIEAVREGRTRQ